MGLDGQTRRKVEIALRILSYRYFPVDRVTPEEIALLMSEVGDSEYESLEDFAASYVRRCSQQMRASRSTRKFETQPMGASNIIARSVNCFLAGGSRFSRST